MSNEKWRDIPGYEGYYQVSDLGRVRSLDRVIPHRGNGKQFCKGTVLRLMETSKGYRWVGLGRRNTVSISCVHTLVALAFIGPRPAGHHVHHVDGDRADNRIENLSYVDARKHVSEHMRGNSKAKGSKHGQAKLDETKVAEIKRLLATGQYETGKIAEMYGVSRGAIGGIKRGLNWKHITI